MYNTLKTNIINTIKSNNKKSITGQILQDRLIEIVNNLDLGGLFLGFADTDTEPNNQANGFYFSTEPGTYSNFIGKDNTAIVVENGLEILYRANINDSLVWEHESIAVDGKSAYDIAVEEGYRGTKQQWLASLKGDKGDNAVNPFKGWYPDAASLPDNPVVGDYAYVKGAESTDPDTIYVCSTNDVWSDSGRTVDTSNVQTFETGEQVNQTRIDDTNLVNPGSNALPKAEDVMQLKAKLNGVTAEEVKVTPIEDWYPEGSSSGYYNTSKAWTTNANFVSTRISVNGYNKVRFIGYNKSFTTKYAYGFLDTDSQPIGDFIEYYNAAITTEGKCELKVEVPAGAAYFVCLRQAWSTSSAYQMFQSSDFYCYLQSGESVIDLIPDVVNSLDSYDEYKALSAKQGKILDEKITNIPEELVNTETKEIDLSTDVETVSFVIGVSSKQWNNYSAYGNIKSAIIPVNQVQNWYFKTTRTTSVQYGFFTSHPTPVNGESAGLIEDTLYFMNTTTYPETEKTFVPVEGAKYMYVKISEGTLTYSPTTITVTTQKFITENDIVDDFSSEDPTKVLSAAVGPQIGKIKEAITKEQVISLEQCNQINFVIATSSLQWYAVSNGRCAIVPVTPESKVYVKAQPGKTTNIGFWAEYPSNPVNGESANLIDGIKYTGTSGHPALDETYTVPSTAHYMYVKLHQDTTSDYTPEIVNITSTSTKLTIDSYYDYPDELFEDTYIEEDIMAITSPRGVGMYRSKLYKIDPNVSYKIILYSLATSEYTLNQLEFYNSSMTLISGTYPASTSQYWIQMEDVTMPEGTVYVRLRGFIQSSLSSQYTNRGCIALMKPIKNDGSMPRNSNIYCVSKIKSPVMPWNYSEAETTFQQTDIWSAWSFMLPYEAQQVTGKKFPLVSFFHGSSGFLTSEYMGYNTAATSDGIVGALRTNGCCVFDINGWGISRDSDQYSRHWGNPIAIATAKKAYEILTTRFNCRKGMVISGISMGGAISKSYAMTYPEDVIACALEAPSEIGCTIRGGMTWDGEVATAWGGYESAEALEADVNRDRFIGYSPIIKPLIIDSDSNMKFMPNVMDYKSIYNPSASGYNDDNNMLKPANINKFYNNFPVEIKIWHGDADTNVSLKYSQCFVNTVRNANGNATLRLCPDCTHNLNEYPWVMQEIINYITDKLSL